jgi:hypothetical protein
LSARQVKGWALVAEQHTSVPVQSAFVQQAWHAPAQHFGPPVHAGADPQTQRLSESHASEVAGGHWSKEQHCAPVRHVPPQQRPPAPQDVPSARPSSGGQLFVEPGQFSAASQSPAAGRHTTSVPAGRSGGQSAESPVQASGASHSPLSVPQLVSAGRNPFVGHSGEDPSHTSATSQAPSASRQVNPAACR